MLINAPYATCCSAQGCWREQSLIPAVLGTRGAGFLAAPAPGAQSQVCVGEKEGLVAPPRSDRTYLYFPPKFSDLAEVFHAGNPTHTGFFPQEIPTQTVNTLPPTRMKNMSLLPLSSSYSLL